MRKFKEFGALDRDLSMLETVVGPLEVSRCDCNDLPGPACCAHVRYRDGLQLAEILNHLLKFKYRLGALGFGPDFIHVELRTPGKSQIAYVVGLRGIEASDTIFDNDGDRFRFIYQNVRAGAFRKVKHVMVERDRLALDGVIVKKPTYAPEPANHLRERNQRKAQNRAAVIAKLAAKHGVSIGVAESLAAALTTA